MVKYLTWSNVKESAAVFGVTGACVNELRNRNGLIPVAKLSNDFTGRQVSDNEENAFFASHSQHLFAKNTVNTPESKDKITT